MIKKIVFRILFCLVIIDWSKFSFAEASFDCGSAKTTVKKTICGNPTLSELDMELANAFSQEKKILETPYLNDFVKKQKHWLSDRGKICDEIKTKNNNSIPSDSSSCLINLYGIRINYIYSLIELDGGWKKDANINGEIVKIIFLKNISEATGFLEGAYKRSLGRLEKLDCNLVINVPTASSRANNYGGICFPTDTRHSKNFEICADDMEGNGYLEPIAQNNLSAEKLATFVLSHCTGG